MTNWKKRGKRGRNRGGKDMIQTTISFEEKRKTEQRKIKEMATVCKHGEKRKKARKKMSGWAEGRREEEVAVTTREAGSSCFSRTCFFPSATRLRLETFSQFVSFQTQLLHTHSSPKLTHTGHRTPRKKPESVSTSFPLTYAQIVNTWRKTERGTEGRTE